MSDMSVYVIKVKDKVTGELRISRPFTETLEKAEENKEIIVRYYEIFYPNKKCEVTLEET